MKKLVVEEWIIKNKAKELGRTIYTDSIYAVCGETEKAYKVIGVNISKPITFFVPKSRCTWEEVDNWEDETVVCDNYEDAQAHVRALQHCFC